jgi:hypothetical protein
MRSFRWEPPALLLAKQNGQSTPSMTKGRQLCQPQSLRLFKV